MNYTHRLDPRDVLKCYIMMISAATGISESACVAYVQNNIMPKALTEYNIIKKEETNIEKLYNDGRSYKEIADQFGLSESTVITYCNYYLPKKEAAV